MYRIYVTKSKNQVPDSADDNFYSLIKGIKSSYADAATFSSFEKAQPTVKKLRETKDLFVYAVHL